MVHRSHAAIMGASIIRARYNRLMHPLGLWNQTFYGPETCSTPHGNANAVSWKQGLNNWVFRLGPYGLPIRQPECDPTHPLFEEYVARAP